MNTRHSLALRGAKGEVERGAHGGLGRLEVGLGDDGPHLLFEVLDARL